MRIKDIEGLKIKIRPFLKQYLEEFETVFTESGHFTCPNRKVHKHEDAEPSAKFYPTDETWKCFSCEEFGDIFKAANYLEDRPIEGQAFITDNVLYFAKKYNISYQVEESTPEEKKKEKLYQVLTATNKMLKLAIKSDNELVKDIKSYIKNRKWEKIIDEFDLGFCLYSKLIENLKKKGYKDKTLKEAGLHSSKDEAEGICERLFDRRLVFPIKNHYGKIVGFASRKINEKDTANKKYLNFGDTALYSKSRLLYNLDKARAYSKIYIVEGYADVFTMHTYGIKNVVALCGTALTKKQIRLLISQGITKIILCLDNDEAGHRALNRIIDKELKDNTELEVYVKELPVDFKDPDDFLNKQGKEKFDKIKELKVFAWKLNKFKVNTKDEFLKNDLIRIIVLEEDYTARDILIKKLAEILEIPDETVRKEVERHEKYDKGKYLLTSGDIINEKGSLEKELNDWESVIWTRKGQLLGLPVKQFPIMTHKFDGIQNMFYLIAADTNVGKSAFLLNLVEGLLKSNDDIFVLLFSIDDTINQIIPRIAALKSQIAINTIANPKFKISHNKDLSETEINHFLKLRAETMNQIRNSSNRFAIKEASDIKNIEHMDKYIRIYKSIAEGKQLVVLVDNLHRIRVGKKVGGIREQFMHISDTLKKWKEDYEIPVIATAEIKKRDENRKPRADDIKEVKDLQFDADLTVLCYTDFYNDTKSKLFFYDEEGTAKPIIEFAIIKNKTSSFKGKLYYKFLTEYSKLIECTKEEMEQYLHPRKKKND